MNDPDDEDDGYEKAYRQYRAVFAKVHELGPGEAVRLVEDIRQRCSWSLWELSQEVGRRTLARAKARDVQDM